MIGTRLIGTGSCVPDFVLSNQILEGLVDTSDAWIQKRTGIRERRIAKGQATWEIALQAAQRALADAAVDPQELDLILVGTVTPDTFTPSVACMVQGKLGAVNAFAFDLNAACSGFVYSVDVADSYIRAGKAKTVLVICAETLHRIIDYTDRTTCVLFGDGAGAAVFQADASDAGGVHATYMRADGTLGECLKAEALPVEAEPLSTARGVDPQARFLHMEGSEVFRFTAAAVPQAIEAVLQKSGCSADQVDWFVLHQANDRIIRMVVQRYGLDPAKVYVNIDRFGNTSSASIPLCLDEMRRSGRLQAGQRVVLCGFGGGLTYGAVLLDI